MAANKEFLTDILDGVIAVQQFLNEGLARESLTPGCEVQRKNALQVLDNLARKIQSSHPSIRPRVNTPGKINKPALSPPISATKPPPIEEDGELYEEPPMEGGSSPQASDYLSFYPASGEQAGNRLEESEDEQETYEAMEAGQDQQEDEVFANDQVENYEDPVLSRPSNISTSLPPPSHSPAPPTQPPPPPASSKGSSEGEYATTTGMGKDNEEFEESMATDWGNVYTAPPKGEKLRVKDIKNVKIKGPLEKLGGRNHKTWQKRYCVLAGALMYFYEKESNKTYNNCIAILSFTANLAPNVTDTKKYYGFKLTHEDKTTGKHKDYYFRTNSAELRDKWVSCIQNVEGSTTPNSLFPPRNIAVASTLPRMPSSAPTLKPPMQPLGDRKRAQSLTEVVEEGEGELYEDMAVDQKDSDDDEEYVDVDPSQEQDKVSQEEYVDVAPQEFEQEEYEEPSSLQPPPPQSPPPGPPSEVFVPPPTQPKATPRSSSSRSPAPTTPAPAPPSEPQVNTSKVYTQNDIPLDKVYVSQWDFVAGETDELGLKRGDLVLVTKPLDSELWWYGELLDADASRRVGRAGFFPKDYSTLAFEAVSS